MFVVVLVVVYYVIDLVRNILDTPSYVPALKHHAMNEYRELSCILD